MNQRELVLSVLKGTSPDRIPWFADLSYWYNGSQINGKLPEKYRGEEGYLQLHKDVGVGIYLYAPFPVLELYDETVTYNEQKDGDLLITSFSTPLGKLTSLQKYSAQTYSMGYIEHFVKEPKDLAVMRYIFEHMLFKQNYEQFTRVDKAWGPYGLPAILPPHSTSPLQLLLTRWAGVETTISLYMDAKNELEQTLSHLQACDDPLFELLAAAPGTLVIFTENLDAAVTGRNFMQLYEIPYWQKRVKQLQDKGKIIGIHNDGCVAGSLGLLSETNFDFVEAVTPAPVGDMEIEKIRDITQDKIIVWGGVPGAIFSPVYSDDFFKQFVSKVLMTFPIGSGFVLGVADQVPPDASLERVRVVRDIIDNFNYT
ncbi:MAG: hypothetical protein WCW64_09600 [Phycisphaerae bacterium]|jgi:hypothetical protein